MIVVVAVASAALMLALTLDSVATRPFDRTFAATNGAHLTVQSPPGGPSAGPAREAARGCRHDRRATGRVDSLRPRWEALRAAADRARGRAPRGRTSSARRRRLAEPRTARSRSSAALPASTASGREQPLETPGGAASQSPVRSSSPRARHIRRHSPASALAREGTLAQIMPDRSRWAHLMGLRLADPDTLPVVANAVRDAVGGRVHGRRLAR